MARRRNATNSVSGATAQAVSRSQPRLVAWLVSLGATSTLFLISHFSTEPCALCRTQQGLMVVLLTVLTLGITDKRPHAFVREAKWVAWAGLLAAAAHLALSLGAVPDPCAGHWACGHAETPGQRRALPALVALLAFGSVALLLRMADLLTRPRRLRRS